MAETKLEQVKARIKSEYDTNCGEIGTTMDDTTALWLARAAIEAMREPTDEMMRVGGNAMHDDASGLDEAWHAMIDAALKEQH